MTSQGIGRGELMRRVGIHTYEIVDAATGRVKRRIKIDADVAEGDFRTDEEIECAVAHRARALRLAEAHGLRCDDSMSTGSIERVLCRKFAPASVRDSDLDSAPFRKGFLKPLIEDPGMFTDRTRPTQRHRADGDDNMSPRDQFIRRAPTLHLDNPDEIEQELAVQNFLHRPTDSTVRRAAPRRSVRRGDSTEPSYRDEFIRRTSG
jgi:hypothetical protein